VNRFARSHGYVDLGSPHVDSDEEIRRSIRIGDDFAVTVVDIKGAQVRIGVQAPKDVPVHREEVFKRLRETSVLP